MVLHAQTVRVLLEFLEAVFPGVAMTVDCNQYAFKVFNGSINIANIDSNGEVWLRLDKLPPGSGDKIKEIGGRFPNVIK